EEAEMKTVGLCKTVEQKAALEALLNHVQTTRGSAVALLAPRGRGKSSLLGLLAAALKEDVLVVAPTVSSVVEVFQRAKKALATRAQVLEHHAGAEDWCLEVMESGSTWRISLHIGLPELSATTLLLDEAARFPPAALQAVLMAAADRAARCVVASTVHGYEGTGSGLMRLVEQLQLEVVRLRQPIRWPPEDPLEGLASKTLQLDPEPLPVDRTLYEGLRAEELSVERVRRPVLLQNEEILREVYGLLSIAHYRTGPGDLRMLLDETRLEVFGLWNRRRGVTVTVGTGLCACALLVHEQRGNLKRHDLLAESLRESLGCPGLEESEPKTEEPLRCVRVALWRVATDERVARWDERQTAVWIEGLEVRVAVHPELQGRGLGRQLVKELSATLQARGVPWACYEACNTYGKDAVEWERLFFKNGQEKLGSVDLLGVVFRGPAPRLWRFWRDACWVKEVKPGWVLWFTSRSERPKASGDPLPMFNDAESESLLQRRPRNGSPGADDENAAYDAALRAVGRAPELVLDLGAGTGLLAALACQAHPSCRAVACEVYERCAHVAGLVLKENGLQERVKVVNKVASDLEVGEDLPRKADLCIFELFDSQLLGESILPILRDAQAGCRCEKPASPRR
ncbi:tRNA(Met) cytidine acetyltransferase TmcA, partial [Durusdinium trenchii]